MEALKSVMKVIMQLIRSSIEITVSGFNTNLRLTYYFKLAKRTTLLKRYLYTDEIPHLTIGINYEAPQNRS